MQMLFITWIYGEQNHVRPMFPKDTPREDLIAASRMFDLAPRMPPVDWDKALWHLPTQDIIKSVNGPKASFADRHAGRDRRHDAAARARVRRVAQGRLWHDDMALNVPGLWFMSWYDVSVGPNLEMFNHVRRTAKAPMKDQQWAVIAPVAHCAYTRASEHTIVGERDMGDARLEYNDIIYGLLRQVPEGRRNGRIEKMAEGDLLHDGQQQVADLGRVAAAGAQPMTFHLASGGRANSLNGDGQLAAAPPDSRRARRVHLRPDEPGHVVRRATSAAPATRSRPARSISARWNRGTTSSSTHRSRSRKGIEGERPDHADAVRVVGCEGHRLHGEVIDVYPDGRAYNLDESIQRMRYRDGYEKKGVDGEGQGLQGHAPAAQHQQLLCGRAPAAHRGVEQQLPALRSQPEYRRQQFRRGEGRGRAQRRAPLEAVPVERDDHVGPDPQHDGEYPITNDST
jgi:hypothetical protein